MGDTKELYLPKILLLNSPLRLAERFTIFKGVCVCKTVAILIVMKKRDKRQH